MQQGEPGTTTRRSRPGRRSSIVSFQALLVPGIAAAAGVAGLAVDRSSVAAACGAIGLGWFGHAVLSVAGTSAERSARAGLEARLAELEGLSALRGLALTADTSPEGDEADVSLWTAMLGADPEPVEDLFGQAFGPSDVPAAVDPQPS